MAGDVPGEDQPLPYAPAARPHHASERGEESVTPGGYTYTVVTEGDAAGDSHRRVRRPLPRPDRRVFIGAAGLIALAALGLAAWFLVGLFRGGGDGRARADVSNIVGVFSQGQDSVVGRYEGKLPEGFPDNVPSYPGAKLISSTRSISAGDVSYLVVYDTRDARPHVSGYFTDKFGDDPWQVVGGQDGLDTTLHQFSRIDDPDVTGGVYVTDSRETDVTTIVLTLQVKSAGSSASKAAFDPGAGKPFPENFPETIPQYPGSTNIESSFRKQPSSNLFAVSLVTKDDATTVLSFYRERLGRNGWTVQDGDASTSSLAGAVAIQFSDDQSSLQGQLLAGMLPEDDAYTRVDIQIQARRSGG